MSHPSRMNAVVAERPGELADVLAVRRVEFGGPLAPGEVEVRMRASTVNPSDAVTVSGAYASRTEFPLVPGFEGVGRIERVGPGVPATAVGLRVLPLGSAGAWQEVRRIAWSWCVPVPADLSDGVACFAYINPLTALLMVRRHIDGSAQHIAISAATSTIAGHLAELLSRRGIRPIGLTRGTPGRTVGDPSLWGAVVDTSDPSWPERVRAATGGRGLDVTFDCVGGSIGATLLDRLTPSGTPVHYGLLSGEPLPLAHLSGESARRVTMFRLRDVVHAAPREDLPGLLRPVFEHLRAGRLRTPVGERIPLTALPDALRRGGPGKPLIDCGA
ncbi:zinc-dependent alcohol dehydrogenase family protein [Microbacterium sp. gxy059]|uniref:zinc-dependent alcohol dehydrogenase family protein n=1 Tax=Microbacterium sp. gxy059 TaxID=2957199 RepID=UPI003D972B31